MSLAATGSAGAALIGFLVFYVSCLAITWWVYARPGGLLFDVENKRAVAGAMAKAGAS